MIKIVAWFAGSKFGRWGAFVLLALIFAALALAAAARSGNQAAMAKVAASRIKNLQTALRANNEITNMSADERRAYVARWLSDSAE